DGGIKARIIGLLKEHEEDALFSKMLATIRTDAPVPYKLPEELKLNGNVLPNVLTLFDELGFRTLKARVRTVLGGGVEPTKEEATEEETEDVESLDQTKFQEAQLMLWLLASDYTNPSLDDILAYTKKEKFDEAYVALVRTLSEEEGLLKVYDTIEKPLIPVLREAEAWGVLVDTEEMKRLSVKYKKELGEIERRIYKAAGHEFNISSPKQLGDVLFDELGLVVKGQKKTTGGQRSTRESELEKIRDLHPVIEDILEYRQVQKLLSTYVDSIPPLLDAGGRLHANFLQAGTTTGRMASQNPNLQNIPVRSDRGRAIRNAFIAPKGFELVALDYSQIELRIAAILSEDEKLMNIFKSGRDVHTEVASAVFGVEADKVDKEMRRRAKIINFGILFGMGVNALKAQLGTSTAEAHQFLEDYLTTFTRLAEYLEETRGYARKHGYTETLFGRRREFSGIKSPLPYVRAQAERMAINAPIQGTEADVIKLAMVQVYEYLKQEGESDSAHLTLQVHDELVYEIADSKVEELTEKIRTIMENALPADQTHGVPIIVEAKRGKNWGEMTAI
ncbi:hypothetical protein KKH81_02800, partial [Patescibacteria group bacterium]|nr:hypothetical protein [Patescibacteria group bacterium]